jgi:hypothetical protein
VAEGLTQELGGFLLLAVGIGALAAMGALLACCLQVRSTVEFALAAYVLSWTWLVWAALALSPLQLLTRGSLLLALAAGLGLALAVWVVRGRPPPPRVGPALGKARDALRRPAVAVLAVAVALGTAYIVALAFAIAASDWDSLAYHLPRAAFWKQEHGLGYVENTLDPRTDVFPPNAEIGQLATMLLAGNDRYLPLTQVLAYGALVLCVIAVARRAGLGHSEALFGALAFATLPVVALHASSTRNDLVVASFLAAATLFGLRPGRASLLLFAASVALAVGTKYTGVFFLPVVALVLAVGTRARRWPGLAAAGAAGVAAGSVWYWFTLARTGSVDGGVAEEIDQRPDLGLAETTTTALRLALGFVDMSGAPWPRSLLFLVPAALLALAGLLVVRRSRREGVGLLAAAALTCGVLAVPEIEDLGTRVFYKTGLLLGLPEVELADLDWGLNIRAEPVWSWFGPLAPLLLAAGAVAALLAWRRGRVPAFALALATAPWALVLTHALTIVWDTWRGRFMVFGVALAAATWGLLLRSTALSTATASIGTTALFLALAGDGTRPLGLFGEGSIWGKPRWQEQGWLAASPAAVWRFVEEEVPDDARIAVSEPRNRLVYPYFGERLSRTVSLVRTGGQPQPDAEWLVVGPEAEVRRCPEAWQVEFRGQGFTIERRRAPDRCF